MEDFPELPRWESRPDWQNVVDLEPGQVLTYETGEYQHSMLILGQESSGLFRGQMFPRIEVETRKIGHDEVIDQAWGRLIGISQDGAGGDIVHLIPPSDTPFAPFAIEQDPPEFGILVLPAWVIPEE